MSQHKGGSRARATGGNYKFTPSTAAAVGQARRRGRGNRPTTKTPPVADPRKGMADLRGSVTPGSMEPAMNNLGEGIQMQIADRYRAGAGYPAGVDRPADYPIKRTRDVAPPKPNPDPTIPATGTLTGGSRSAVFDMEGFMSNIGNPQGVNLRNRFSSTQLPGSADHATALNMTPGEFETGQGTGAIVQLGNGRYVKTADLNNDN